MMLLPQAPEARAQWLSGLKVGDKVACVDHGIIGQSRWRIFSITRLTPTQALCGPHWRFRLKDGGFVTGCFTSAEPVHPAARCDVEAHKLRDWFGEAFASRSTLSLKTLRAMKEAHDLSVAEELALTTSSKGTP